MHELRYFLCPQVLDILILHEKIWFFFQPRTPNSAAFEYLLQRSLIVLRIRFSHYDTSCSSEMSNPKQVEAEESRGKE